MNDTLRISRRLPEWLKKPISRRRKYGPVVSCISGNVLHTVCTEARCPNRGECYSEGTTTFLILGNVCTRNCTFCGIDHGNAQPTDPEEPKRIASAARSMELRHVVITSVTRDDLPDGGASHFSECIRLCRASVPDARIEVLIPDFSGSHKAFQSVATSRPDILCHNVETVPRLYPKIRPRADYRRSLDILRMSAANSLTAKSGIMTGLGESDQEIIDSLRDLRAAGCSMVTIGQYLQPSLKHMPPERYVTPDRFMYFEESCRRMGFDSVAAGPFIRSSYRAASQTAHGNS